MGVTTNSRVCLPLWPLLMAHGHPGALAGGTRLGCALEPCPRPGQRAPGPPRCARAASPGAAATSGTRRRSTRLLPRGVLCTPDELRPIAVAQITFLSHLCPSSCSPRGVRSDAGTCGNKRVHRGTLGAGWPLAQGGQTHWLRRQPGPLSHTETLRPPSTPSPAPRAAGGGDTWSRRGGLWLKTELLVL